MSSPLRNTLALVAALVACAVVVALAVRAIRRAAPPSGWPIPGGPGGNPDVAAARGRMVDGLLARGLLRTERAAEAMRAVERHRFVPDELQSAAYADAPLPIGEDQAISAPGVVALMTELVEPEPGDVMLEVGTGSGYQAAILARLVSHVYSVEIVPALAQGAETRLRELGYDNVTVRCGDGYQGWPEHAPFDGILVTCAPDVPPPPLVEQLGEGGRMVIPVDEGFGPQWLTVLTKRDGRVDQERAAAVRFVPMTGEALRRQR